jgi:hypothetical protein
MQPFLSRFPKRVKQGLVVAISVLALVLALQYFMGSPQALHAAAEFLVSNAEIRQRVGLDVQVKRFGSLWRSDFGWTPGSTYATYELQLVGQNGSMRARIKLKKSNSSEWVVYSATLWTPEGPVAIR